MAPNSDIESVLHPSDFSPASELAFAHALKVALGAQAALDLLHAQTRDLSRLHWQDFPAVRATLERWGLLSAGSSREAVLEELGVHVSKISATGRGPLDAILTQLERAPSDLVVLATEARTGLPRWLRHSVAEPVSRRSKTETLFVPQGVRGFVSAEKGEVSLGRVLIPVDTDPNPTPALRATADLFNTLDATPEKLLLAYIGEERDMPAVDPPLAASWPWERETRKGAVVDQIVAAAGSLDADLIVMTTRGHQGFLDALRGSTTEQVLRRAPCPVLAVHGG